MKKIFQFLSISALSLLSTATFAQEKSKIRKEVKVEEVNGTKTMKVVTEQNGKTTEEVYKGAEADAKLAELEGGMSSEMTEDVKVEEINGQKKVTITKSGNGTETVEEYTGEDADKKLKELEGEPKNQPKKVVMKKKVEVKKIEKVNKD